MPRSSRRRGAPASGGTASSPMSNSEKRGGATSRRKRSRSSVEPAASEERSPTMTDHPDHHGVAYGLAQLATAATSTPSALRHHPDDEASPSLLDGISMPNMLLTPRLPTPGVSNMVYPPGTAQMGYYAPPPAAGAFPTYNMSHILQSPVTNGTLQSSSGTPSTTTSAQQASSDDEENEDDEEESDDARIPSATDAAPAPGQAGPLPAGAAGTMCLPFPLPAFGYNNNMEVAPPFFIWPMMTMMLAPPSAVALARGSGTAISLFMSMDAQHLSEYQILVRKQLELFVAGPQDVESMTQGRRRAVALHQVGIRCRHCASLPLRVRGRAAVYYPTKLSGVYQAAQNMASSHLHEACLQIPERIRDELTYLRNHKGNAGGGKQYWADQCRALGVIETEDGLRLGATASGPVGATATSPPKKVGATATNHPAKSDIQNETKKDTASSAAAVPSTDKTEK